MARTVIDIDDDALAGAMKALGTTSKVATVNAALAAAAGEGARREALIREMARGPMYAEAEAVTKSLERN